VNPVPDQRAMGYNSGAASPRNKSPAVCYIGYHLTYVSQAHYSLSQRLVLTPQLRQRIEMLQMTSLELTDLIQQQLTENPVLEEVATQEEARELAEKILDHMASGGELENFEAPTVEATSPDSANLRRMGRERSKPKRLFAGG